jgi:hypothetical protein
MYSRPKILASLDAKVVLAEALGTQDCSVVGTWCADK